MFSSVFVATALSLLAVVSAAPAEINTRSADTPVTIELCTADGYEGTCLTIPVVSDECVNFTGGFSILNKEVSSAVIPGGMLCTFFEDFGCLGAGSSATDEVAVLGPDSVPAFSELQGIWGSQSFNDLTSSFSCSPV